jgi:tetratricopeptide (TPR) repeat protein
VDETRADKLDSAATGYSFRYSAAVFSLSTLARAFTGIGLLTCTACAGLHGHSRAETPPQSFYTVTAEIALVRHEQRVAALQYAAAAAHESDPGFLQRAAAVGSEALQPTLVEGIAERWKQIDPKSLEARRAAGQAALSLYLVDEAAADYRFLLSNAPGGVESEFADVETDLEATENIFGAREVADRLASYFPNSPAALRLQGMSALRADDPAAAVRGLSGALALRSDATPDDAPGAAAHEPSEAQNARHDLTLTLARAKILAGDVDGPLSQARLLLTQAKNSTNRFDYAVLLMTAQRETEAEEQLDILSRDKEFAPVALRLVGLIEFGQGHLDASAARFTQLLKTGKFQDDAFFYLALIADRNEDAEKALRFFAQVQKGENVVAALLRAAALLQKHNAQNAAGELLDRLLEDEPQRAPEILTARARMYNESHDAPKAFAVLDQAVREYPDSTELRYAIASLYEDQGEVAASLRELTRIVKLRPNDPAALNALGFTLADHSKELPRARKLIERAHAAAPRNAAILDSMGWVAFRQGHPTDALPFLTAAYADDRSGDIAAHLGEVLWYLGQHDKAEGVWSEASLIDTDNQLLKSTRKRLQTPL